MAGWKNWQCETAPPELQSKVHCSAPQPAGAPSPSGDYKCNAGSTSLYCPGAGAGNMPFECKATSATLDCEMEGAENPEQPGQNEADGGEHDGEHDGGAAEAGEAKLPYDVKPQLGATVRPILDAFAEEGPAPAAIVSVVMDGGSWRLAELQGSTPFAVTKDDCSHAGSRDVGRDRVFVSWKNADGSVQTDHLDIRYCEQL